MSFSNGLYLYLCFHTHVLGFAMENIDELYLDVLEHEIAL